MGWLLASSMFKEGNTRGFHHCPIFLSQKVVAKKENEEGEWYQGHQEDTQSEGPI